MERGEGEVSTGNDPLLTFDLSVEWGFRVLLKETMSHCHRCHLASKNSKFWVESVAGTYRETRVLVCSI
jgi:hypothetical protein